MAIRNIRVDKDACLYKKCRAVEKFDERLSQLIDDMFETMYDADGVGLAAPQVGILRRVVVIDTGENPVELINPEIIHSEGIQQGYEGCLSFPGESGYVERSAHVVARGLDRHGTMHEYGADGLFARAIQHELDHLDGVVYLSRATEPPEEFLAAQAEAEEHK